MNSNSASLVTPPSWTSSDEQQPLLREKDTVKFLLKRIWTTRKCFASPAILTILAISFLAQLLFHFFSNPAHLLPQYFTHYDKYSRMNKHHPLLMKNVAKLTSTAVLFLVYPLAGYLADTKLGHYRTILVSLRILVPSLILTLTGGIVLVTFKVIINRTNIAHTLMIIAGAISFSAGLIPLLLGVIGIGANVVQLGLDQLFDSPWDDQIVFVHWYMWVAFTARLVVASLDVVYCTSTNRELYYIVAASVSVIILLAMTILLILATRMKRWFVTDYYRCRRNSYQLIFRVTRYAWRNKILQNRSAYYWCKDQAPSRLDVADRRFGGPFTTQQVKDVKVFYGIVKVLLVSGLFFFFAHVTYDMNEIFKVHIDNEVQSNVSTKSNIYIATMCPQTLREAIRNHVLPKLLVVILQPFIVLILRPLLLRYVAGILKTVGIMMALNLLPMVSALLLDSWTHYENRQVRCMFAPYLPTQIHADHALPVAQTIAKYFHPYNTVTLAFIDLLSVFVYVNLYKLICSQGPHSTKGFLVGLLFAVYGFYDFINPLLALLLGYVWSKLGFPSCGMFYYLLNIVLGLGAVLLYVHTARRYKYCRRALESPPGVSDNAEVQ